MAGISAKNIKFVIRFESNAKEALGGATTGLKKTRTEAQLLSDQAKGLSRSMGKANFAALNTSRFFSDAGFIFTDVRLGVMALSNNIDPLIQSFIQLKEVTKETNESALKAFFRSLKGSGGIMVGVSMFTMLITAATRFMGKTKEAKKAVDELISSFNQLTTFSVNKFGSTNISSYSELTGMMQRTQDQMDALKSKYGDAIWYQTKSYYENPVKPEDEEGIFSAKGKYKAYLDYVNSGKIAEYERYLTLQKINEQLQKQIEKYNVLRNMSSTIASVYNPYKLAFEDMDKTMRNADIPLSDLSTNAVPIEVPIVPKIDYGSIMDSDFEDLGDRIIDDMLPDNKLAQKYLTEVQSVATAFQTMFSDAWTNIFGEANSMLEKFFQSMFNYIVQLESKKLATSFLSFLPGGSIIDAIAGLFGTPTTTTGGNHKINNVVHVFLDGKEIASATTPYLPSQLSKLQRRRLL